MSKKITGLVIGVLLLFVFFGSRTQVEAQTPRPTPTPRPTSVPNNNGNDDSQLRGTIQGLVYEDVNNDGVCVNSGVEGENPVGGVDIEFVSSDEATVLTLFSGPEGIYGMFETGQSVWRVTAKPSSDWVVTSENPLYVPIVPESLTQTGVNFCVQKASTVRTRTLLPAAGAPATGSSNMLLILGALLGLAFIGVGFGLYRQEQSGKA